MIKEGGGRTIYRIETECWQTTTIQNLYKLLLVANSAPDLRVAPHIVDVETHEVPQAMRQEDGTEPNIHHLLNVALEDPRLHQLSQCHPLRQPVHVRPHYP